MATQAQVYEALLKKHGRAIAEAFRRVVRSNALRVNLTELTEAIEMRNLIRVGELLGMTPERLFPLSEAVRATFIDAGVAVETIVPVAAGFNFNGRSLVAERWIAEHSSRLVQDISDEALTMAREVIGEGVATGRSSQAVARDLVGRGKARTGGRIGLTTQQARAVGGMRNSLDDLTAKGGFWIGRDGKLKSNYELRDRRYDAQIKKAITSGKPLTEAQINTITGRYAERSEGYRARVIAQDQARNAISSGQAAAYNQLLDDPDVEAVTKRWQYNFGNQETHREDHMSLGQAPARPINEPFIMGDGTEMMHSHDPNGGAEQNLHCHCTTVYRVVMRLDDGE